MIDDLKSLDSHIEDIGNLVQMERQTSKRTFLEKVKSLNFCQTLVSKVLGSYCFALKSQFFMTDFTLRPEELTGASIEQRLSETTESILKHKERHSQLLKQAHNVEGLYDYHISKLIRREWWLVCALSSIRACFSCFMMVVFFEKDFNFRIAGSDDWRFYFMEALCLLLFAVNLFLGAFIKQQCLAVELKTKRALQTIIYRKLSILAMVFLESSDNNLIAKLLYSTLDRYKSHTIFTAMVFPQVVWIGFILYQIYRQDSFAILVTVAWILLQFIFNASFQILKKRRLQSAEVLYADLRKVCYEFINQFKSFNLKNLRDRYQTLTSIVAESKVKAAMRFLAVSCMENFYLGLILTLALLWTPFHSSWAFGGVRSDAETPLYGHFRAYYSVLVFYAVTYSTFYQLNEGLLGYLRYRKASAVLSKFLDTEYVINPLESAQHAENKGDIHFENCKIFEKDQRNLKDFFDSILDASPLKHSHSLALARQRTTISGDFERRLSSRIQSAEKNCFFARPIAANLLLSNFSVSFSLGTKVCIFENEQKQCIKGFIRAILGENYVRSGNVYLNGSISYFNPTKSQLLVGKTIRENILFGSEYVQDRYEEILKVFGVQFGNYKGYDFHQVAEKGLNLRTEDIRMILFARFLYQDCDIYIIEDYFGGVNLSIMKHQIKAIIKHVLQQKTVIFCSNNIELIEMSDTVITFESASEHIVVPSREFLQSVDEARKASNNGLIRFESFRKNSTARTEVIRSKIKNSVFIANISFEEELAIMKKLGKRRSRVDQMKEKYPRLVERLAYGIYLVEQKRHEGRYLQEERPVLVTHIRSILRLFCSKKSNLGWVCAALLLKLASVVLGTTAEYMIFREASQALHLSPLGILQRSNIIVVLVLLGAQLVNTACSKLMLNFLVNRQVKTLNKAVLHAIINSNIRCTLNRKHYTILQVITKHMFEVETKMPSLISHGMHHLFEVLTSMAVVSYNFSLVPVVTSVLVAYSFYRMMREIAPVYIKLSRTNSTIESKIDDLNFQLLSLIGGYRIAGKMAGLLKKLSNLCDNLVFIAVVQQRKMSLLIDFSSTIITVFYLFSSLLVGVLCYTGRIKWMSASKEVLVYTGLYLFKPIYPMLLLQRNFLDVLDCLIPLAKIDNFIKSQKTETAEKHMSLSKTVSRFDYKASIVFKNVSLTKGDQPILKKITITIPHKSRVGLFSVEGGGRSNIFELLTKIIQRDKVEKSKIFLYGRSIEEVNEETIKETIFVVERTPVLFEGTVQDNIDPYCRHKLEDLVIVLRTLRIGLIIDPLEASEQPKDSSEDKKSFNLNLDSQLPDLEKHGLKAQKKKLFSESGKKKSFLQYQKTANQQPRSREIETAELKYQKTVIVNADNAVRKIEVSAKKGNLIVVNDYDDEKYLPFRRSDCVAENLDLSELLDNRFFPQADLNNRSKDKISPNDQKDRSLDSSLAKYLNIIGESNSSIINKNQSDQNRNSGEFAPPFSLQLELNARHENKKEPLKQILKNKLPHKTLEIDSSNRRNSTVRFVDQEAKSVNSKFRESSNSQQNPRPASPSASLKLQKSLTMRRSNRNIIESSPYAKSKRIDTDEMIEREIELDNRAAKVSDTSIHNLLYLPVGFEGKSIREELRKCILFARIILEKPQILLTYEDSLNFGKGVEVNLETISEALQDSTIICITNGSNNLYSFQKIFFLDAGKVIEQGNPRDLVANPSSYLHRFLKETDKEGLDFLKKKLVFLQTEDLAGYAGSSQRLQDQASKNPAERIVIGRETFSRKQTISSLSVKESAKGANLASSYHEIAETLVKKTELFNLEEVEESNRTDPTDFKERVSTKSSQVANTIPVFPTKTSKEKFLLSENRNDSVQTLSIVNQLISENESAQGKKREFIKTGKAPRSISASNFIELSSESQSSNHQKCESIESKDAHQQPQIPTTPDPPSINIPMSIKVNPFGRTQKPQAVAAATPT